MNGFKPLRAVAGLNFSFRVSIPAMFTDPDFFNCSAATEKKQSMVLFTSFGFLPHLFATNCTNEVDRFFFSFFSFSCFSLFSFSFLSHMQYLRGQMHRSQQSPAIVRCWFCLDYTKFFREWIKLPVGPGKMAAIRGMTMIAVGGDDDGDKYGDGDGGDYDGPHCCNHRYYHVYYFCYFDRWHADGAALPCCCFGCLLLPIHLPF